MKALLTKIGMILAGTALVAGAPVIPQETPLLYSYETPKLAVGEYTIRPEGGYVVRREVTSATSSQTYIEHEVVYDDFDVRGLVYHPYEKEAISVFAASDGEKIEKPITKEEYAAMAEPEGYKNNPKNTENVSLVGARKAHAAIAWDATTIGTAGVMSSQTFAVTVTGANTLGLVSGWARGNARTVTGITWNGASMTEIGTQVSTGLGAPYYDKIFWFYGLGVTTGNVVITYSGSDYAAAGQAVSYTGVKQSGQPDGSNDIAVASSNTLTGSVTVTADNSWVIMIAHWFNGGQTPSTNCTARYEGEPDICEATDNPAGASESVSVTETSVTTENRNGKIASFAPAVAAAASNPQPIIRNVWWD